MCIIRDGKQLLSQKQIVGLERTEGIWLDNVRTGTGLDDARVLWDGRHACFVFLKLHAHINDYNEPHIHL